MKTVKMPVLDRNAKTINDAKVLTTFLTTTQTKLQVFFYTVHGFDFRFQREVREEK